MKFMLMMQAPRGKDGEWQVGDWKPEALKAHMAFMGKLNAELRAEGVLAGAEGLAAPGQARLVRAAKNGSVPEVTDGPFAESKEFLAGYWIVDVDNAEQAYAIAARASAAPGPGGEPIRMPLEVRQVMSGPNAECATPNLQKIVNSLWFDDQAEEAAKFYVEVFGKKSRIVQITHYGKAGTEIHGRKPGSVMTVNFELDGQLITALNGGPHFKFNEAVSLQVMCETQAEIDHYWDKLSAGGDPKAQQCGWLKDRYGLSWQIVPRKMDAWWKDGASDKTERAFSAMLKMKKLDIAALEAAYNGTT